MDRTEHVARWQRQAAEQTRQADEQKPKAAEQAPQADQQAPQADQQTPQADQQTPQADQQMPQADQQMRFSRVVTATDRADDFLEIEIGGRRAQVFRPIHKGKRLANYYVKGYPPGSGKKAFYQSTGFSTKGLALEAARKLWRAAVEGRFDVLEKTKLRQEKPLATIGDVIAAHGRIGDFNFGLTERAAQGYRNSLRRIISWAKWGASIAHGDTAEDLLEAGASARIPVARVDALPASVLTEELVEAFLRTYVAAAGQDLKKRARRIHGALAAIRLGRTLFDRDAMKCYRALTLPDLTGFLKASTPTAPRLAHDEITPAMMREIATAALELKQTNPALYLAHLLFRHAGMRNDEIEHARAEWIERLETPKAIYLPNGERREVVAFIAITKRSYWQPKQSEGRVPLSADVLAELEPFLAGLAPSDLLIPAATKTARWELLNIAHNNFVRPWLADFRKKGYELRRWAATTVANHHQSEEMGERFLRHAPSSTAGKHYLTTPPTPAPITLADVGI